MNYIEARKLLSKLLTLVAVVTAVLLFSTFSAKADESTHGGYYKYELWGDIVQDHKNYYSWQNLWPLGVAFGVGGVIANTDIDEDIRDWYQDDSRNSSTDDISDVVKNFGEGKYIIPFTLLAAGAGYFIPDESRASAIGEWGVKSARTYLVGVPTMLLMQRVTGASRPEESSSGSKWDFFNDSNGVSGHSFVGAVSFMTIAKMNKNLPIKILSYGASMLCGWSRINDDDHYASQAALGWFMALQASNSVFRTGRDKKNAFSFNVIPVGTDGVGIMLSYSR